jgi:uncharacterized protein
MHCPDLRLRPWLNRNLAPSITMSDTESAIQSPCVGNCCLDDDLTCLGCFRSLEEIKEWTVVHEHRRRVILRNAEQRRAAAIAN